MRYVPAACVALGVCGAVSYALYMTKDLDSLFGLIGLISLWFVMPSTPKD